jgi:apolipoprotein D and lipocalin family protein
MADAALTSMTPPMQTSRSNMTMSAGRRLRCAAIGLLVLGLVACGPSTTERSGLPELQTVSSVDLGRYLGTWYEIASFPQRFQEGCTGTTATYTLREDGDIDVLNRCFLNSLDGEENTAHGRARVVDTTTNAKLKVSFFRPFWGDYWIIDLGPDYEYAVVGHPGRDYLWILSRSPQMDEALYQDILERLEQNSHYEINRLQRSVQPVA